MEQLFSQGSASAALVAGIQAAGRASLHAIFQRPIATNCQIARRLQATG